MHTCTPLPTTPVGGTVEGDWYEKAFDLYYSMKRDYSELEAKSIIDSDRYIPQGKGEESPQADKENIAEEMRYAEQLERAAEYQAQLLEYNTNPHKY